MYVIHYHVPGVLRDKILPRLGLSLTGYEWVDFGIFAAISVGLAALSWHFFEGPINGLKRYFPYAAARHAAGSASRKARVEPEPAAPPAAAHQAQGSPATNGGVMQIIGQPLAGRMAGHAVAGKQPEKAGETTR